jgi:hypothetical protein
MLRRPHLKKTIMKDPPNTTAFHIIVPRSWHNQNSACPPVWNHRTAAALPNSRVWIFLICRVENSSESQTFTCCPARCAPHRHREMVADFPHFCPRSGRVTFSRRHGGSLPSEGRSTGITLRIATFWGPAEPGIAGTAARKGAQAKMRGRRAALSRTAAVLC